MHRATRDRSDPPLIVLKRSVRQLLWMTGITLVLVILITGRVYELY